jgi:tetratricopeptide (TPR) repeat protein
MATGNTRVARAAIRFGTIALGILIVGWGMQDALLGQQAGQISMEDLIGNAVSLSNQKYPEIEQAITRFNNNDVEGAREYLDIALQKNPKLPPPDLILAKMSMLRNLRGSNVMLERAVMANPDDPEAYLLMANQAFVQGRTTESAALFELAAPLVEKFKDNNRRKRDFNIRIIAGRAAVAERRKQWDTSKKLLEEWIKIDPDSAPAHTRLAISKFHLGENKEAFSEFTKARELDPNLPNPLVSLARLLAQDGDLDKAGQAFDRAYKENRTETATVQAYAEWLVQQGQLDKAQEVAHELLEQTPDSVEALLLEGVIAFMRKEPDRAEQAFRKVLSIDDSNANARNWLALLLIESDKISDREKALQYATVNAERFSDNSQANTTLAWVYYKLGRSREAQAALQRVGQGSITADSAYLISKMLADQGQEAGARTFLEQVMDKEGGLFIFRDEAKKLYDKLGQPSD